MPAFQSLLLCQYANQTADGMYNLLSVFDEVVSLAYPVTTPMLVYVRILDLDADNPAVEVRFIDPKGNNFATMGFTPQFLQQDSTDFVMVAPVTLVLGEAGDYLIEVWTAGVQLGKARLRAFHRSGS